EYFRIWIVNTFLVLITLGQWSPWAKIRKRQFMLRHTWVADANFEFHARPWPILRGRLIAGTIFVVYWFTGNLNPQYAAWVALCVAIAAPWLIVSALRFNMANTSYRNLRFAFDGTMRDASAALWPLVLVGALTVAFPLKIDTTRMDASTFRVAIPTILLALFYPYMTAAFRLMLLNHTRLGTAKLVCSTRVKTIYGIYFRAGLMGVGLVFALILLVALVIWALTLVAGKETWMYVPWAQYVSMFFTLAPMLLVMALLVSYVQSRVVNATFNLTTIADNVRVFSHLRMAELLKNHIVNTFAMIASCGLLIPWTAIRTARLRVESTSLGLYGDLDDIIADRATAGAAAADAASYFFALDIGI
ncbi:MAG TPA: YjgN family protein, partial [Casimicrobium sp.]|nr:YjgN family protein [Casimicrobium sp.]